MTVTRHFELLKNQNKTMIIKRLELNTKFKKKICIFLLAVEYVP